MKRHDYEPPDEAAIPMLPMLLTMQQAADLCQVGMDRMREWSRLPGFPVYRTPQMVRIHRKKFEEWLEEYITSGQYAHKHEVAA